MTLGDPAAFSPLCIMNPLCGRLTAATPDVVDFIRARIPARSEGGKGYKRDKAASVS